MYTFYKCARGCAGRGAADGQPHLSTCIASCKHLHVAASAGYGTKPLAEAPNTSCAAAATRAPQRTAPRLLAMVALWTLPRVHFTGPTGRMGNRMETSGWPVGGQRTRRLPYAHYMDNFTARASLYRWSSHTRAVAHTAGVCKWASRPSAPVCTPPNVVHHTADCRRVGHIDCGLLEQMSPYMPDTRFVHDIAYLGVDHVGIVA